MIDDWIESIASRAKVDDAAVRQILAAGHVDPDPVVPTPHSLKLNVLSFSGTKTHQGEEPKPFEVSFEFPEGLFAIASEQNLAGKSSVLKICRWALSGHSHLDEDVRRWLEHVNLDFTVDNSRYRVTVDCKDRVEGALTRLDPDHPVGSFSTQKAHADVMGEFMSRALALSKTPFWQSDGDQEGARASHGWATYIGALYVTQAGEGSALIGDEVRLAHTLVQVFIGLPWYGAYSSARVAASEAQQLANRQKRVSDHTRDAWISRRKRVEDDLANATSELDDLPETVDLGLIDQAVREYKASGSRLLLSQHQEADADADLERAQRARRADQQKVLDLEETHGIHRFFHGLDPVVCPRCDHDVSKDRKGREDHGVCGLCGEGLSADPDGLNNALAEARQRLAASDRAVEQARAARMKLRQDADEAQNEQRRTLEHAHQLLRQRDNYSRRREVELRIAKLRGVLEALGDGPPADDEAATQRFRVLDAAQVESETRLKSGQEPLFKDINAEILSLAQRFGMPMLETVILDRAGRLKLTKGGDVTTSYSKVSPGEQLRLRLALQFALLRQGHLRGVGRHPGVLLIDTIAAEELNQENIVSVVSEIKKLTEEIPHLQVILATSAVDAVEAVVPPENCRVVKGHQRLW